MNFERRHRVGVAQVNNRERLDRFLAEALPIFSRSRLKVLIERGQVSVSGETINEPSYRVKPGQSVVVTVPPPIDDTPRGQRIPLQIVYEDQDLVVVDKPAGLVVHPAPGNPDRTLANALIAHCGDSLSGIGGVRRPGIVHRLDKDTSGLIVAAKHDDAHQGLAAQFASRDLSRTYHAVIWGTPDVRAGEIRGNIGRSPINRKKMAVLRNGGKPAITRYRVIRRLGTLCSLVECHLKTGRTHQIRVHLAARGHPVVGDVVYGRRGSRTGSSREEIFAKCQRQALHAISLGLRHPVTGVAMKFSSSLPEDIEALIKAVSE